MIKCQLRTEGGALTEGDDKLIDQWRKDAGKSFLWLDIEGDVTSTVRNLLKDFGCHELAISDTVRVRHPPKVEAFEENTFVLFRGITSIDDDLNLVPQQIGFFIGDNYLVSLHRGDSVSISHFWEAQQRIEMLATPGILAMQIMHYSCSRYLEVVLDFEDQLTEMEDSLLAGEAEDVLKVLVGYRSRLRKLRRIFNYHQRLSDEILTEGSRHLDVGGDHSLHVKRDLYDRCERLYSLCNMYYEICGDLIEGYISISSHQLNNTMKILTIITAIFVPLGFIAGLYGMNFDHMPELHYRYSYFIALGVMVTTATTLILLFKRKRWL